MYIETLPNIRKGFCSSVLLLNRKYGTYIRTATVIIMLIYRVIQEEMSVFWEVIVSVSARNICSHEHVSNSEWISR